MTLIPSELLDILVCTVCHGELREDTEASELVCTACARRYPVEDGIPDMVVDDE